MTGKMSGVVKEAKGYGAAYRRDLDIPSVGERDVLVRVRSCAVCGTDVHIMNWTKYASDRLSLPMVFGHEFAGDVVEAGSLVTEVAPGDMVAGETHIPCNGCAQCALDNRHICENMKIIGVHVPGAFAQYISFPADCAFKLPAGFGYDAGALLEPMGVAVHGVDKADVRGKSVLILGCGPIGLMAVAAARAYGAKRIVTADLFEDKLKASMELGADVAINPAEMDIAPSVLKMERGGVDAVIDYSGAQAAILQGFAALRKGGIFVMVGLPNAPLTIDASDMIIYKEAKVVGVTGRLMYKTWNQCVDIINSGKMDISKIIGGVYDLADFQSAFESIKNGTPGKMIMRV